MTRVNHEESGRRPAKPLLNLLNYPPQSWESILLEKHIMGLFQAGGRAADTFLVLDRHTVLHTHIEMYTGDTNSNSTRTCGALVDHSCNPDY